MVSTLCPGSHHARRNARPLHNDTYIFFFVLKASNGIRDTPNEQIQLPSRPVIHLSFSLDNSNNESCKCLLNEKMRRSLVRYTSLLYPSKIFFL